MCVHCSPQWKESKSYIKLLQGFRANAIVSEVALNWQVIWIKAEGVSPTNDGGPLPDNILNQVGHPKLLPEQVSEEFYIMCFDIKVANLYSLGLWGRQTSWTPGLSSAGLGRNIIAMSFTKFLLLSCFTAPYSWRSCESRLGEMIFLAVGLSVCYHFLKNDWQL